MRAALRSGDGVNFVEDQRLHVAQHFAAAFGSEQDEERFGRGDQNVRRVLHHLQALGRGRVAGADGGADRREQNSLFGGEIGDAGQRDVEILLNVVREGLQWRDVENLGVIAELAGAGLSD